MSGTAILDGQQELVKGSGCSQPLALGHVDLAARTEKTEIIGRLKSSDGKGAMEDAKGGRILIDPEHKLGPGPYFHHLMGPGGTPFSYDYVGKPGQGLKARGYHTQRETTVITVLKAAMRAGAVMVTGPPRSGKTSLLQLLHQAAVRSELFSFTYYVNIAENDGSLEEGLAQHGTCWEKLFTAASADAGSGEMGLLLVDEAQLLFGKDVLFWSGIKALLMGPQPFQDIPVLRVIVACSYICSPSGFAGGWQLNWPSCCIVTLDSGMSLDKLQFSKPEYQELLCTFRMLMRPDALFSKEVRRALYHDTAGQAGLITGLLDHTLGQLEEKPFQPGEFDKTLGVNMKPGTLKISLLAPFQSFLQKTAKACPQTRSVLRRLLKKDCRAEGINQIEDWGVWSTARDLYYKGYFAQREVNGVDHIGFISLLHRQVSEELDV
ncbi:g1144 [Coccomyxa viridis]|uniref:G1144 protein n=1 Tax=Coccomyxa viridis TaxID=1274662 RepID=A0ABP1FP59_9CHLO